VSRATFDDEMMGIALRMAERGLGTTAPNPSVGAVIANEQTGEVIARGWTQRGGRPHAETEALGRAGDRAKGATLYVTLEPCSHTGKTPPCVDAVFANGLKRVVIGVGDPDPRVAGQGIAKLKAAGIEVIEGVRAAEARWVTLGHINRITRGRPFIQVKIAVSENGVIPHGSAGRPLWVTGEAARARGHLMRAEADAIVTGVGTVLADDPELTCRLPGLAHRSPLRIVIGRFFTDLSASKLVRPLSAVPVRLMGVEKSPISGSEVADVLLQLGSEGITRVLIEAGPRLTRAVCEVPDLVDDIVLFRGAIEIDAIQGTPLSEVLPPSMLAKLNAVEPIKIGSSTMQRVRVSMS
jgi:diaminohydroxyphosphoribosylaminopyrimidine deaminase / 5-amino-6-(5-phosphoribosylamino)uracil reductase